ncbi:hypothetical protein [Streptomyces sp. R08]|uniref:Uncharacterized protein n=1 Tax=Streptomyces sp. R08 TaxID=3238624 RepID=A0AB39MQZ4_9ACTN
MHSLVSAVDHQPDHWDLLVPINQLPVEQMWFDGLRVDFLSYARGCGAAG